MQAPNWEWQGYVLGKWTKKFNDKPDAEPLYYIEFGFSLRDPAVRLTVPRVFYESLPPRQDGQPYPQTGVVLQVVPAVRSKVKEGRDSSWVDTSTSVRVVSGRLAEGAGRRAA